MWAYLHTFSVNCPPLFLAAFFSWSFTPLPNNGHLLGIAGHLVRRNHINVCVRDSAHEPLSTANWSGFIHFLVWDGINKICPWFRKWNLCLLYGSNERVSLFYLASCLYLAHINTGACFRTDWMTSKYIRGKAYYIEVDVYWKLLQL